MAKSSASKVNRQWMYVKWIIFRGDYSAEGRHHVETIVLVILEFCVGEKVFQSVCFVVMKFSTSSLHVQNYSRHVDPYKTSGSLFYSVHSNHFLRKHKRTHAFRRPPEFCLVSHLIHFPQKHLFFLQTELTSFYGKFHIGLSANTIY